jgi:arsenate reductase (thioredoxin)
MGKNKKLKILFLCTGNSCRSQMAEAFTNYLKGDEITAFSAGTKPRGIDPRTIEVMEETGIDLTGQKSQDIDEFLDSEFDFVITLCGDAKEACPIFPGKSTIIHRGFDDPPRLALTAGSNEEALSHYRRVRDEIREFIETLPGSLKSDQNYIFME